CKSEYEQFAALLHWEGLQAQPKNREWPVPNRPTRRMCRGPEPSHIKQPNRKPEQLIAPRVSMPFADFVCIQRSAARADRRANRRTFLSASECADAGASNGRACHRQFVAMLLPESSAMANATMAYSLRGS